MKKSLSIFSANLLYLIAMLLAISVGAYLQSLTLSGGLIATAILLVLLTVWFLRARKVPLKVGLRLNPIRPEMAVICMLLGLTLFLLSVLVDAVTSHWSGMASVPLLLVDALTASAFDSILYFIALTIFVSLGEEFLFRGAIQGAYEEHRSPLFAVLITAAMFAFYHFQVFELPALLLVSLVLGYVAWRTGSIYASLRVHFGMNAAYAVSTLIALQANVARQLLYPLWPLVVVFAVGLIGLLNDLLPDPFPVPVAPAEEASPASRPVWLKRYWPLFGTGLLYLGVAGLTLVSQLIPATKLEFQPPRIDAPIESHYQVINHGGENVGELVCTVTPQGAKFRLDCARTTRANKAYLPFSDCCIDLGNPATWNAVWDSQTLDLLEFSFKLHNTAISRGYHIDLENGSLFLSGWMDPQQVNLSKNVLLEYEWFWRVNNLNAGVNSTLRVSFGKLWFRDESQNTLTSAGTSETLSVRSAKTPDEKSEVWSVTIAGQTAWYDRNDPSYPRPIQFDDGDYIYSLVR